MTWTKFRHFAYICRFGRQSLTEVMGRSPTKMEWHLFEAAIQEILEAEYAATPPEMRSEDD